MTVGPQPDMEIRTGGEEHCSRCLGPLYLSATMPHPTLPGMRTVGLCPACDANDPAAQDLLAFFAIHGRVEDPSLLDQLAELIAEWVTAEHPSGVDDRALDVDIEAWRKGLYD